MGDGKRACRSHSETAVAAEDMRAGEKFAKEKEREKENNKRKKPDWPPPEYKEFKPRCWVCNQEGLHQQTFMTRFLIESKKFELVHGHSHNPFDAEEIMKAKGALNGERCLFYVKWHGDNTKIRVPKRTYDTIMAAQQLLGEGIMLVCAECCKERGFKTMSSEQNEGMGTDDFWKKLSSYAAVYQVFVDPVITAQAQGELQAAN